MKRYLLTVLLGVCTLSGVAQTARWALGPKYASITPYDEKLIKVKIYNKVGLVDRDGKFVVEVTADSITKMRENIGLVLKLEEGRYRLLGLVDKTPRMIPVSQEMYVTEFPFFSEGKLVVANKRGNYGFLNTSGQLILNFDYSQACPFSEGWAAVSKANLVGKFVKGLSKKGKMIYVNAQGQQMSLSATLGDVNMATSFNKGEALVVTKENRYCIINPMGQVIRIESEQELQFNEKYGLVREGDEEEESNEEFTPKYDGPDTYSNDKGLLGYKSGNKTVLPPQFMIAYPFSGGVAIASPDREHWGLLKLLDGDFTCKTKITSVNQDNSVADYTFTVPKDWGGQTLKLFDATEASWKYYTGTKNGYTYAFSSIALPKGNRRVVLGTDNLLLWSNENLKASSRTSNLVSAKENDLSVSFSTSSVTANKNKSASFRVYIRNKSSEAKTVQVTLTGDRLGTVEKSLTIAPNSRESIVGTFSNITTKEVRSTHVKISGMENTVSKGITVNPFYEDF